MPPWRLRDCFSDRSRVSSVYSRPLLHVISVNILLLRDFLNYIAQPFMCLDATVWMAVPVCVSCHCLCVWPTHCRNHNSSAKRRYLAKSQTRHDSREITADEAISRVSDPPARRDKIKTKTFARLSKARQSSLGSRTPSKHFRIRA